VTASYSVDDSPPDGSPLDPGASPAAIRAGLLPEDRERFDALTGTAPPEDEALAVTRAATGM
jgi:hypothetical protein